MRIKKFLALATVAVSSAVAQPVSAQTSTVSDPVGDVFPNTAPAFQDAVMGQMTKTASGDFELLMGLAGPVPLAPPLPPPGVSEIWWTWVFDFDSTTLPRGYPFNGGRRPEFVVYVSWNGTEFAGTAIDRRPLLTGGEAIIAPVPFSINGTIVEVDLASTLIGDVPPSFVWTVVTFGWSGPVGSEGSHIVDIGADASFNP